MPDMSSSLSMGQFGSASESGGANYSQSPLDPKKTQSLGTSSGTAGMGPLGQSGAVGGIGNASSGLTGSFGMGAGGMGAGGLGM